MSEYDHYPQGTELLWKITYRDPNTNQEWYGKEDGTLQEAVEAAEKSAEKEGGIVQMISRRY